MADFEFVQVKRTYLLNHFLFAFRKELVCYLSKSCPSVELTTNYIMRGWMPNIWSRQAAIDVFVIESAW